MRSRRTSYSEAKCPGFLPSSETWQLPASRLKTSVADASDLHGLRKTYGTMLAAAGVSPRVAMELMRHSDMKLTMGVYTDVAQLPMIAETARLPSLPPTHPSGCRHPLQRGVP